MEDDDDFDFTGSTTKTDSPFLPPPSVFSSDEDDDELPSLFKKNTSHALLKETKGKENPSANVRERKLSVQETIAKTTRRISEIEKLRDIDRKCVEILGDKNVLEQTEEVIRNHEKMSVSSPPITPTDQTPLTNEPTGQETAPLSMVPDLKVFVKPITYIEDISVPIALRNCQTLSLGGTIDSNKGLRDLIVNKLLLLVFRSEPCPVEILFWLLEISCLSCDVLTRVSAFSILVQLLRNRGLIVESLSHLSLPRINDLLVKLGAVKEQLNTLTSLPNEEETVHSEKDIETIQISVKYITTFITMMCQRDKLKFDKHEEYVFLLLKLALDSTTCQSLASSHVSTCLNMIMSSVNSDVYERILEIFLNAMTTYTHTGSYHYCVYLLQLIPVTTPQHRNFQRHLMKFFLESLKSSELQNDELSDQAVVQSVIEYYLQLDTKSFNYKQVYAVMTILAMFVKPPDMTWSSAEGRSTFLDDLGCLGTKKIRENIAQAVEKGLVKDLIIRIKLDLEQESRDKSRQSNLFDFFMQQSQEDD